MRLVLALLGLSIVLLSAAGQAQNPYHDTIIIVLDGSGSMESHMPGADITKMSSAKRALKEVIAQVEPETHVGLLVFADQGIQWAYDPAAVDEKKLNAAIDRIRASGGTPLGESIKIAADRLMVERKAQHGLGRYQLLVLTDGEADDTDIMSWYASKLPSRQIAMDVIGVAMSGGAEHSLAKFGRSYQSADDAGQLVTALKKAIVVEAGGDSGIAVDFDETANVEIEVARQWLQALTTGAPNDPLGEPPASAGGYNCKCSLPSNNHLGTPASLLFLSVMALGLIRRDC